MDKSKSEMRKEYERDLRPFDVTDEEIDALLEQLGYRVQNTFIFNTRRKPDDEEKQR